MTLPETVFFELERLAAAAPYERVDLWIQRTPKGELSYVAYLNGDHALGMNSNSGHGNTPAEAVDSALRDGGTRDPNVAKQKKIDELEMQIARLRMLPHVLPPWQPVRELAYSAPEPVPEPPAFVNIESTTEEIPL